MKEIKKQFQKVIGNIRKDRNQANNTNSNFPKPIMTVVQMEKREATVNCGGEWLSAESTKEIADTVMTDPRFKAFLENHKATARIETNTFKTYQIRINF